MPYKSKIQSGLKFPDVLFRMQGPWHDGAVLSTITSFHGLVLKALDS